MTMPTLTVEIGFTAPLTGTALHIGDTTRGVIGTATIAPDNLFTDVSEFVTSVTARRGATRADGPYLRYEAGSLTIRFRNDDRRFDPTNLAGPYVATGVTQVEPMRAVQILATWNGRTYPVWRGFTDEWTVGYDGPNSSWAQVTCFDAFGVFAAQDRAAVPAVGAGEDSGQRISRILNALSWPVSDKVVSNGDETVQATTLAGNALTELLLTADTELGELWMDAQGRVMFRSRSASYFDERSQYPVVHFGDEPADGDTTINLVSNPSVETSISGWAAGGSVAPTLAQSSTRARFGSASLLVTWGSGGFLPNANYDVSGLMVGRVYTISVYVWVPTGSRRIDTIVAGTGQFGRSSSVFDAWERLTWTGTASATSMEFQLWPRGTATAGQQVWVDGLQVEAGVTATAYVDGEQAGCEWDGVAPHASTSRRLPELPYADTALTYDALSIVNQVRAARVDGSEQVASDSASLSQYLTRTHTRSDLIMQNDAAALMWAEQIVARTALPELRFASVELKPRNDPDRLWPQAFGREIGDRVRVTRRPPGGGDPIVRACWIRGVEHELTTDLNWKTTFVLEQARDLSVVTDGFGRTIASWGPTLNADPNFEATASPWTATGGTATRSTVQFHEGSASLLLTPDGVAAVPEVRSENASGVVAGQTFRATAWLRCAVARSVNINIVWRDTGGTFLSSVGAASASVAANTWEPIEVSGVAPASAAQGQISVSMGGTPPASHLLHIDEAILEREVGGWGNADGNVPWITSGATDSDFSVTGGFGRQAHPSVNVLHTSAIELGGPNQSVGADITCPVVPAGAPVSLYVAGRYLNASNYYQVNLSIDAGGAASIFIGKRVAGALTPNLVSTAVGTHTAGNTWRVQLDVIGTTVRARAWRPGVDSMPDWQAVTTDTSLSAGTQAALMSRRETGNTDGTQTITFDTFSASTRGAWD